LLLSLPIASAVPTSSLCVKQGAQQQTAGDFPGWWTSICVYAGAHSRKKGTKRKTRAVKPLSPPINALAEESRSDR